MNRWMVLSRNMANERYGCTQTFVLNLSIAIGVYGFDYTLKHVVGIFQS
jgi:hypothetical protein